MSWEAWGDGDEFRDDWPEKASEAGWIDPDDQSQALIDVMNERARQQDEEGWTHEHDDEHVHGELAGAAAVYAAYRSHVPAELMMGHEILNELWPFSPSWLKPKSRRQDLVRAAALLLAEIERLDRADGGKQ